MPRRSCRQRFLAFFSAIASFLALGGCRLSESPRYARLQFAPESPRIRVLMIGNSLTFYNDLPGLLQQFSTGESAPIAIEQITIPYAALKWHWELGKAAKRIDEGHFDYVILQDFSRNPVTDPQESVKYFELFDAVIKKSGAKTIIFENWTRRGMENEYDALMATYHRVEQQTAAIPAPIGTAWRAIAAARPDITLFVDDRHPTDAGSYAAACVLYDVIYAKRSADLPTVLPAPRISQEWRQSLRTFADRAAKTAGPAAPP